MLRKRYNKRTGRTEWALVSRSKSHKILKWFGLKKPSEATIARHERRVNYFKKH